MKEEQKEITVSRKPPGAGEQYLLALMKCAEWVPKEYKMLADKNKMNTEVVKELYLCACDGVPVEKAAVAQEKNPPEGALRFIRQKHIENAVMGDYKEDLAGIKNTANTLEREVMQMSRTLNHIVNNVPNFDSLFPEDLFPEEGQAHGQDGDEDMLSYIHESIPQKEIDKEHGETGQDKHKSEETGQTKTLRRGKEEIQENRNIKKPLLKNVPNFGTQKIRSRIKKLTFGKKSVSAFVGKLLEEGYDSKQIDYLLNCIEEGMELEEVKKIASPKLPVDVMKRLRKMEERKENDNGKR